MLVLLHGMDSGSGEYVGWLVEMPYDTVDRYGNMEICGLGFEDTILRGGHIIIWWCITNAMLIWQMCQNRLRIHLLLNKSQITIF